MRLSLEGSNWAALFFRLQNCIVQTLVEALDQQLQRIRQLGDIQLNPCPYISDKFISNPPHRVGIAHLAVKPRFLLADPTGTGKTPQMLAAFGFLKLKAPKLRMLVMPPKSALFQWKESVSIFNVNLDAEVVGFDPKSGSRRSKLYRYDAYERSDSDVLLLSYHQMARDIDVILEHIDNFVVVFDEIQAIKSTTQKLLYPSARKLSQKARYVWGATATPIMNRLDELYAIMDVIYPGMFGSYDHFKKTYFELALTSTAGRTHYVRVGYQNLPQLMLFMRPFYIKRPASLINIHLPQIVTKLVLVDMEAPQATTYSQIVAKYFPGNEEIKARRLTKLASLTYAQMTSDAPSTIGLEGGSAKADELERLLLEEFVEEKVIVYTRFERTISYISHRLAAVGIEHRRVTGKENPLEREQAKKDFNELPDVNVILINDAGGEAINLQSAGILICFNLPWSWGRLQQIIGRARRRGSKHAHLLVALLMARGTIDEHTYSVLQVKERLVADTFGVEGSVLEANEEDSKSVSEIFEAIRSGK